MSDDTFAYREARTRFLLSLGCGEMVPCPDGDGWEHCSEVAVAVVGGKMPLCAAHEADRSAAPPCEWQGEQNGPQEVAA